MTIIYCGEALRHELTSSHRLQPSVLNKAMLCRRMTNWRINLICHGYQLDLFLRCILWNLFVTEMILPLDIYIHRRNILNFLLSLIHNPPKKQYNLIRIYLVLRHILWHLYNPDVTLPLTAINTTFLRTH